MNYPTHVRIIPFLLGLGALGVALMTLVSVASAAPPVWGDANCSGIVTQADVDIVVLVAAGGTRPAGCTNPVDLNCNGTVSSVDISIASYIAGGGSYTKPAICA